MQKFSKQNWFRLGTMAFAVLAIFAFAYYLGQKNKVVLKENNLNINKILEKKIENTEEAKKAELVGKDKEEVTFDQPIDIDWEGEIMATFVSGQDYGIKKTPKDENFPYFYAYTGDDSNSSLEGSVKVKGKWTGITCAYQNTVFKKCVPEVEADKIELSN